VPLFAERLLVDQVKSDVPEPDRYDEELCLSVMADGQPYVEMPLLPSLITLTEAEGEGDTPLSLVTRTKAESEGADPLEPQAASHAWAVTITRADAEAPDKRATAQERPAFSLWAITKTSAPGEAPDKREPTATAQPRRPFSLWAITETAVPNEAPDR
jgi:hypothetical protein